MECVCKQIAVYHVIKTVFTLSLLSWTLVVKGMAMPFHPKNSIGSLGTLEHEEQLTCGGSLEATHAATTIRIPQTTHPSTTVYCEWIIRAQHPSWKIGLAAVEVLYTYFQGNAFDIDVYDGFTSKDQKLWHGREFHTIQRIYVNPLTSSTDTLFINYTATGTPSIEMKLIYYLCGGLVQNEMEIASPIFNANTTYEVPIFLQCNWVIEKPQNAYYGYIHLHNIDVPYCDVLSVTVIGGDLIYLEGEHDTSVLPPKNSTSYEDEEFARERDIMRSSIRSSNNKLNSSAMPTSSDANQTTLAETKDHAINRTNKIREHQMTICNRSNGGIAFNGSRALISFSMFFPQKKYGFHAIFVPVRKPKAFNVDKTPWYFNYATITIYFPIGLICGILIIYVQTKRRKPPTVTVSVSRHKGSCDSIDSHSSNSESCMCMPVTKPKPIIKSFGNNTGTSKVDSVTSIQNNNSYPPTIAEIKTEAIRGEDSKLTSKQNLEINKEINDDTLQETFPIANTQLTKEPSGESPHLTPIEEKCELLTDINDRTSFREVLENDGNLPVAKFSQLQTKCLKSVTFVSTAAE